jgi:hypothetical protein
MERRGKNNIWLQKYLFLLKMSIKLIDQAG